MNDYRQVLLYLNSSLERYSVAVYDGCHKLEKQILTRQGCLCLCTKNPCLRIVATPLVNGYSTKLYFWLNTGCTNVLDLYFNFPPNPAAPPLSTNTFTLTDGTYGLPIDGTLTFTQA